MVVFPSKAGIDAWSSLGNPGWSWRDMQPYYRKFHTLNPPTQQSVQDLGLDWIDAKNQGTSGPVQVSFAGADFYGPLHTAWPETFKNLNCKISGDPLSGLLTGAYCNPTTVDDKDKSRSYSASAYYNETVAKRSNLHVLTNTQVSKVVLEGQDPSVFATRVEWTDKGIIKSVFVAYEIVLCAGTVQSPQVLELSGIGDAALLRSLGIKSAINNPNVGENLQDHALASISFEVKENTPTAEAMKEPGVMNTLIEQYNKSRSGPLTSSAICNAYMPLPEYLTASGNEEKRIELRRLIETYTTSNSQDPPSLKAQYELLRSIIEDEKDSTVQYHLCAFQLNPHVGPGPSAWLGMKEDGCYVTVPANLSHPLSRGSIHITSNDVKQSPRIDPKYLSNPLDLEILARHVQYSETIVKTPPLGDFVKADGRRVPAGSKLDSLEDVKHLVKETLVSTYHLAGTCAMMPRQLGGVVNERLVVHGTKNLRVVDASIFPLVPRGNIQTSVYAVAEKAADLIKEDWVKAT